MKNIYSIILFLPFWQLYHHLYYSYRGKTVSALAQSLYRYSVMKLAYPIRLNVSLESKTFLCLTVHQRRLPAPAFWAKRSHCSDARPTPHSEACSTLMSYRYQRSQPKTLRGKSLCD